MNYQQALDTYRAAWAAFDRIRCAFRAGECDDAALLAAQKTYHAAAAAMDAAERAEEEVEP